MKEWVKYRVSISFLLIILIITICGLLLIENSKIRKPAAYSSLQIEAAKIMSESIAAIRAAREEMGIPIDSELDPNKTGLIGDEFTLLTTTVGNLSAKRTSTNPDFAALMIKFFLQADLQSGDTIAIGSSGSFPALLLATFSACKAMGITPISIYAIGASEYGATIPNFTFIDILKILNQKNIINYQFSAVSMGGNNDHAEGMLFPESKDIIKTIVEQSGITFINTGNLVSSIEKRLNIYNEQAEGNPIKLFVNIGGASANYGETNASITFPNGLVKDGIEIPSLPERGLIFEFLERGIPVIHLLNIRDLALKNNIMIDPIPLPEIGQSEVYFQYETKRWIILLTFTVIIALFIFQKKYYNGKKI